MVVMVRGGGGVLLEDDGVDIWRTVVLTREVYMCVFSVRALYIPSLSTQNGPFSLVLEFIKLC